MDANIFGAGIPIDALNYQSLTPTFGNMIFNIKPSDTGEVSHRFGTIPYMSLESMLQLQRLDSQQSPSNMLSGQQGGQQNIQGTTTIQDANGQTRMVMGYQPGGF